MLQLQFYYCFFFISFILHTIYFFSKRFSGAPYLLSIPRANKVKFKICIGDRDIGLQAGVSAALLTLGFCLP